MQVQKLTFLDFQQSNQFYYRLLGVKEVGRAVFGATFL